MEAARLYLLKLINGLLVPTSGEVRILGNTPGVGTKSVISYLPNQTYLSANQKVTQIIDTFADFYADFDHLTARTISCKKLNIQRFRTAKDHVERYPGKDSSWFWSWAAGQKLYCLDEPIARVGPLARDYILTTILNNYAEDATILISTHLIQDIENILDEVVVLQNGKLKAQASVEDIRMERGVSNWHDVSGGVQMLGKINKENGPLNYKGLLLLHAGRKQLLCTIGHFSNTICALSYCKQ